MQKWISNGWQSSVEAKKNHLVCPLFQLEKAEFCIYICVRYPQEISKMYCQPDDRQPWQSMAMAGLGDFVAKIPRSRGRHHLKGPYQEYHNACAEQWDHWCCRLSMRLLVLWQCSCLNWCNGNSEIPGAFPWESNGHQERIGRSWQIPLQIEGVSN